LRRLLDRAPLNGRWTLPLGFLPGMLGLCVGFTLAAVID
jgi:hypothetical protein